MIHSQLSYKEYVNVFQNYINFWAPEKRKIIFPLTPFYSIKSRTNSFNIACVLQKPPSSDGTPCSDSVWLYQPRSSTYVTTQLSCCKLVYTVPLIKPIQLLRQQRERPCLGLGWKLQNYNNRIICLVHIVSTIGWGGYGRVILWTMGVIS